MEFCDLINKKDVNLSIKNLQDDDLEILAKALRKSNVVVRLGLWRNRITLTRGGFADSLARNQSLEVLDLSGNEIGTDGAKQLAAALRFSKMRRYACLATKPQTRGPNTWRML